MCFFKYDLIYYQTFLCLANIPMTIILYVEGGNYFFHCVRIGDVEEK